MADGWIGRQAPGEGIDAVQQLPHELTPLIGRDREVRDAVELLATTRVLTVTGAGGVGKTRLALAVAHALVPAFPDGVVFVPLASVRDAALVVPAVASALGVRASSDRQLIDALAGAIGQRRMLLVLDNLEQIEHGSAAVRSLVEAGPAVRVLATSRSALRLSGEQELPLAPLALPSGDARALDAIATASAVALFVERARACRPDFQLTQRNAPTIAAICRRLDGLPLAIELAAAWLRMLTPRELLERLGQRLALLTGGPVDLPERQQTMRATIAWSVRLLDADARGLFARLASFPGGWTLAGAEAVAADAARALPLLALLVDHHLVEVSEEPDGTARYRMLATIREYAEKLLDASEQAAAVRQAQAAHMLDLAEHARSLRDDPSYDRWLDRLERERDNLRAALRHALPPLDLQLAAALYGFWYMRGSADEGAAWHERALVNSPDAPAALRARTSYQAGELTRVRGDYPRARELADRSLEIAAASQDEPGIALARFLQGNIALSTGELDEAERLLDDALARYRALADDHRIAFASNNLGLVLRLRGEPERAEQLIRDALAIWTRLGDVWGCAIARSGIADAARLRGNLTTALHEYRESLRLFVQLDDRWGVADGLSDLGDALVADGSAERGALLLIAGDALRASVGVAPSPAERGRLDQALAAAQAAVGDAAWARLHEQAAAATPDEIVALALAPPEEPAPAPAAHPFAGLSPRELQVLQQLMLGHSNQQIATVLRISPHTVATHVTAILNKLGVDSRTAAATLAARHLPGAAAGAVATSLPQVVVDRSDSEQHPDRTAPDRSS